MPDMTPQNTLDTNASEVRLNRFESAWLAWRTGEPMPCWQDHLPAEDEPCSLDLIFHLVQMDIECRIKAGLPALLAEPYFAHPRLQRPDARLDEVRQVELIQWEYFQRLHKGERPRRADYEAAFPRHIEALREMKPRSRCPRCQEVLVLEETFQTLICPHCGMDADLLGAAPPFVASTSSLVPSIELDLRHYEPSEALGRGGMGEVYRCVDPALGRDLAIKVIKAEFRGDEDIERRFLREARITGSLQHPGIVPVYNLGRLADGRLHYTMRLIRGRTFADILKEEAGKPERLPYLLSIFEKICQAAAYAHSKHVIHRDLKPHNVMVGRFGEVQVMDWGLAKLLTTADEPASPQEPSEDCDTRIHTESVDTPAEATRPGSGMGTPAYTPPEQALGEWGTVDERADVFALGSILCETLTGEPAYSGQDGEEVLRRARRGDVVEALSRVEHGGADAALRDLCRDCLTPVRESRPRNAGVVVERVACYQTAVQARLRQAELERAEAQVKAREERKRRRLAVKLATIVLALAAGLTVAAGLLIAAWKNERAAKDSVAKERDRAVAARSRTREALDTMTSEVSGESLTTQPKLSAEQSKFLKSVLTYYQEFAAEPGEDRETVERLAAAHRRLGIIYHRLGRNDESKPLFERAIALYGQLADEYPQSPEYRTEQAYCRNSRALLLSFLGQPDQAEKEHRAALAIQEGLVAQLPEVPDYRKRLANSHNNLGTLLMQSRGRHGEADAEYRAALALQERLVEQFPDEPTYRSDLASSHRNRGLLLAKGGRDLEAENEYRAAQAMLERLVEQSPDVPDYRDSLAANHLNLGALLFNKPGREEETLKNGQAAMRIYIRLAMQFPADPSYLASLSYAHSNVGSVLANGGRYEEAEKAFLDAHQIKQSLAQLSPEIPAYRRDLGYSYHNLGQLKTLLRRYEEAETQYLAAVRIKKELVEQFRDNISYAVDLGGTYNGLGELDGKRKHFHQALDWYGKAIDTLRPVSKKRRLATTRLRDAYSGRAEVLTRLTRRAEAEQHWQEAANLENESGRVILRMRRANALAQAGEHREAVNAVEELLASSDQKGQLPSSGELLYKASGVYALSCAAIQDDTKRRERYAAHAIALLRQAKTIGLFKDLKQVEKIKKDADLETLRKRHDLTKLIAELEPPGKK